WKAVASIDTPYSLVGLDGGPRETGNLHLVSPRAAPCTGCHRLGSEKTCTTLAADALGAAKAPTYEAAVSDAMTPGSPYWRLAYWMPDATREVRDFADWNAMFEDARDHILTCCESPGENVGDCEWAAVPAE